MPVDIPPIKKPSLTAVASSSGWSTRTLNWSAFVIGLGLCLWAINYSVSSEDYSHAPISPGMASTEN